MDVFNQSWLILAGGLTILIGLISAVYIRIVRNNSIICSSCSRIMRLLPDEEGLLHLDQGQLKEVEIGSVKYRVYACPGRKCGELNRIQNRSIPYRFTPCSKCGYRTLETTTRVHKEATRFATGRGTQRSYCRHCRHTNEAKIKLPKKTQPKRATQPKAKRRHSDYGGGYYGDFFDDGGSSDGGGASGSW